MKSPEEIKKGLECCFMNNCDGCPYDTDGCADNEGKADALAYIIDLEQRLAQAERERDALMYDFALGFECHTCKHETTYRDAFPCNDCAEASREAHRLRWEWRGVCEENSKEGEADEGRT